MQEQFYGDEPVVEKPIEGLDKVGKDEEETQERVPVSTVEKDDEVETPVEYTEAQKEAMSKGWKPEGVEGKPKLSADEFLRNEEFFDKIHKQNKHIKKLEQTVEEMTRQHSKIAELERKKVLDSLNAAKKKALAEEDYDKVIELDDQIAETRNEVIEEPKKQEPKIDPEFYQWQTKNTWYDEDKDPALFQEATALGAAYNSMTGATGLELYTYVERTMKRLYPEKTGGVTKTPTTVVEGSGKPTNRKPTGKKKYTAADLNEVQRSVMKRYVKSGVLTEQEYIDELARIGELG